MAPPSSLPLAHDAQALLRTQRFGRPMQGYQTVGSTNTEAMRRAAEGAPEGAVVVTEYQTAGRGRQGRAWHAEAGQNLMFSVILRPALPPPRLNLITLAAGVALAETIEAVTAPVTAAIKWPNDVLLEGRKCCGMLLESTLNGPGAATVVLGVGLNVNQSTFPPALEDRATSLLLEAGRPIDRAALLADLLHRLECFYDALPHGEAAIRRAYTARLQGLGRPTTLRQTARARSVTGVLVGVTETGAICLDTPDGPRVFHAGDVTGHDGF